MAIDRQGTGLTVLRVCLGVFFLFEGIGKVPWLFNSGILAGRFHGWLTDPDDCTVPTGADVMHSGG